MLISDLLPTGVSKDGRTDSTIRASTDFPPPQAYQDRNHNQPATIPEILTPSNEVKSAYQDVYYKNQCYDVTLKKKPSNFESTNPKSMQESTEGQRSKDMVDNDPM